MKKVFGFAALLVFASQSFALAAGSYSMTSSGLASDSAASVWGKLELSTQAGATLASKLTAGVVQAKASYRLGVRQALVYAETGLGVVFNTDVVMIPVDFGTRVTFNLSDIPAMKPHVHLSMGPAIATSGTTVRYHMFFGPGMMYRVAQNMDARFDMGLALFGNRPGFQFVGGVAL